MSCFSAHRIASIRPKADSAFENLDLVLVFCSVQAMSQIGTFPRRDASTFQQNSRHRLRTIVDVSLATFAGVKRNQNPALRPLSRHPGLTRMYARASGRSKYAGEY